MRQVETRVPPRPAELAKGDPVENILLEEQGWAICWTLLFGGNLFADSPPLSGSVEVRDKAVAIG